MVNRKKSDNRRNKYAVKLLIVAYDGGDYPTHDVTAIRFTLYILPFFGKKVKRI